MVECCSLLDHVKAKQRTSAVAWGLGLSLMLNAGLASWLVFAAGRPHLRAPATASPLAGAPAGVGAGNGGTSHPAPTAPAANAARPNPAFHWSRVESDDYRQYIANLRAVGCPEATIRDIVSADLGAVYTTRARAIWTPRSREYWQKDEGSGPDPGQVRQLVALAKEEAAVSRELLGGTIGPQQRIDALLLQLHGSERQLLFLPEDRRAAALAVLSEAEVDLREEDLQSQGRYSGEKEREMFAEKLKCLAKVLSPAEVEEFRLRHAPEAQWLRTELQYFNCTPDEFRQLLEAREAGVGAGTEPNHDLLNRQVATDQVRKLFGEERAVEFERVTDMHYQQARRAVDDAGLPAELADQAWEISRDARRTAQQWATNAALPVETRILQVRGTQEEADRRLQEVLGEKASRAVRRDLKLVLRGAEAGVKP